MVFACARFHDAEAQPAWRNTRLGCAVFPSGGGAFHLADGTPSSGGPLPCPARFGWLVILEPGRIWPAGRTWSPPSLGSPRHTAAQPNIHPPGLGTPHLL